MTDESTKLTRRALLGAVPVAGVAAALPRQATAEMREGSSDDPRRVVLKDTPHIRSYYQLARN